MARTGFKQRKPARFKKRVRTKKLSFGGARRSPYPPKELSQLEIQGPLDQLAGGGLTGA